MSRPPNVQPQNPRPGELHPIGSVIRSKYHPDNDYVVTGYYALGPGRWALWACRKAQPAIVRWVEQDEVVRIDDDDDMAVLP